MSKINLDKAQNINVIAKRGDDFNLSFYDNSLVDLDKLVIPSNL